MRIDNAKSRGLSAQVTQDATEHNVFHDVGKIAGVEGMAIVHGITRETLSPRTGCKTGRDFSHRPRSAGIEMLSRRQPCRAMSGQPRNDKSLARQNRTSVSRLASQATEMA